MIPKFALSMLVALAVCAPLQEAAAQESTLGGALFGGAAGAIVGGAIGGGAGLRSALSSARAPAPRSVPRANPGTAAIAGIRAVATSKRPVAGRPFRHVTAVSRRNTPRRRGFMTTHRAACARRALTRAVARSLAVTATSVPVHKDHVLIWSSGRTGCGWPCSSIET
jgi:hypothetical protein